MIEMPLNAWRTGLIIPFSCKQGGALRLWAVLDVFRTTFPKVFSKKPTMREMSLEEITLSE